MPVDSETDVGLGLLDVKGRKIACATLLPVLVVLLITVPVMAVKCI